MQVFPLETLEKLEKRPRLHFIGIGGVHMSAIAELLSRRGFPVTGNDRDESDNVRHLRSVGIDVMIGHKPEYVENTDIVVRNAAIHDSSPDIARARELGLPVYERQEVLGALMRGAKKRICIAGTHGKSTTTAMCARIASDAETDPTVFCGAKIPETGVAYRFGGDDLFIAESCEYCDAFLSFYPTYAVILNVEPDHLDYFSGIDQIRASFRRFASLVPEDGVVVAHGDDTELRAFLKGIGRKIITVGWKTRNEYYPDACVQTNGCYAFDVIHHGRKEAHIALSVPGRHNITNALAAYAVSRACGMDGEGIALSLSRFAGTKRRFERIGSFEGVDVIDDFAHHPTEISATIAAAKGLPYNRVICIYQPHTYTRTEALYRDFAEALKAADAVLLAPIYAAREINEHNISSALIGDLVEGAEVLSSFEEIEKRVREIASPGDLVMTVGAGDVYKIGYRLIQA